MNAIVVKQWLWGSEEDFETESLLSQSLSFKTYKFAYHRHIHACSFRTVQKEKSTIVIWDYADTRNKDRLYLWHSRLSKRNFRWSYITIRCDTASVCAKNSCDKRYSNCFYLRSLITKGQIQVGIRSRIGSLRQFRLFALEYFLAYTSDILLTWKLWNWGEHCFRCPPALILSLDFCHVNTKSGLTDPVFKYKKIPFPSTTVYHQNHTENISLTEQLEH